MSVRHTLAPDAAPTKLTLRLETGLIEKAKVYARRSGKSLSQLVADYFESLTAEKDEGRLNLPPLVRSLRGSLKGADLTLEDYRRHLEEKYT